MTINKKELGPSSFLIWLAILVLLVSVVVVPVFLIWTVINNPRLILEGIVKGVLATVVSCVALGLIILVFTEAASLWRRWWESREFIKKENREREYIKEAETRLEQWLSKSQSHWEIQETICYIRQAEVTLAKKEAVRNFLKNCMIPMPFIFIFIFIETTTIYLNVNNIDINSKIEWLPQFFKWLYF